jgi:tRNA pseudouridine13 synthase
MDFALRYPYGDALAGALMKSKPEDFEVEEVLGFEPDGEGEHLFLWIEKVGLTTPELVSRISRDHGLEARLFSHSGLKDKHALTRQWLSLHLPGKADPFDTPSGAGYCVVRQLRHSKKLRPGTHRANLFRLRLRQVAALADATRQQIDEVATHGFANYFGQQRFGRDQNNPRQALSHLRQRRLSRSRRGLLLSSLRSYLFNRILARRIELGYWAEPLPGDVFMLRGSHSIFSDEVDAELIERYRRLDISSCASLYGAGQSLMSGEALAIEQAVFESNAEMTDCLQRQGARLQMRPIRAAANDFSYCYDAARGVLELEFELPTGSYATSLLSHFLVLRDVSQPGD